MASRDMARGAYDRAMESPRIRHTVSFRLGHPAGSAAEADFLAAAEELAAIDGVEAFELLRQVGAKNTFDYGISMEFADQRAYDAYNEHPAHVRFVAERWPEVAEFLELDYAAR
jgi:Stress responsive A/B Barrel Domain